jgi:adenylate cyclase
MLPLTALMTAVLYRQNSRLTVDMAQAAMDMASAATVAKVRDLIGPVASTVELWTMMGKATQLRLRRAEAAMVMMKALSQLPAVYSLYYGFEDDGTFLQVIRLPPETKEFGPRRRRPSPDTQYVLRTIDNADGVKAESYTYYSREGSAIARETATEVTYDPRARPWYKAARAASGMAKTDVYLFSSVDQPGITFSRPIESDAGTLIGVFGADILTATLSDFLSENRVGRKGVIFIFDDRGSIVAYPDPTKMVSRDNNRLAVAKIGTLNDASVADAVRYRDAGGGSRFRAPLGEGRTPHLVSFADLRGEFGQNWTVGVIADENEFVAPLRRASVIILAVGVLFLLLACVCVMRVSRFLTRPIGGLIEESRRMRHFELEAPVNLSTRITEIQSLVEALGAMKTALRSFGRYVPKEVVRDLVSHGDDVAVGGGRRVVTVMFSDIANFTKTTEHWPPESVLDGLSGYFEALSKSILVHKGTIDKFIGDGIMALWNAPSSDDDHVSNACLAALGCRAAGRSSDIGTAPGDRIAFRTRFGIHTGMAVVGNVGSSERLQYTALGSTVNLASRIEALNKHFGTEILISENVAAQARGRFELRPLGPVLVFGTSQPIEVYELLGTTGEDSEYPLSPADIERNRLWKTTFKAYTRRQWSTASEGFSAYLARHPADPAAALMRDKCRACSDSAAPDDRPAQLEFGEK